MSEVPSSLKTDSTELNSVKPRRHPTLNVSKTRRPLLTFGVIFITDLCSNHLYD